MEDQREAKINDIFNLIMQLATGDYAMPSQGLSPSDKRNIIVSGLNILSKQFTEQAFGSAEINKRLNEILDAIIAIASLDYSRKAPISDHVNIFDAIACGLNMLSAELLNSTVSREYMDDIINSVPDSLIVISEQGILLDVNKATCSMLGYAEKDIIGRTALDFFSPQSGFFDEQGIRMVVEKSPIASLETSYCLKGGRSIPVLFSSAVMTNYDDTVKGIVCFARDITERKKAENSIQLAREYADNIIKSMPDCLFTLDTDSTVMTVNKPALKLLGFSEQELIGRKLSEIISVPGGDGSIDPALQEQTIQDYELSLKTSFGEEIPVSLNSSIMRDRQGAKVGIVCIARDMRDSRLVKKLQKMNEDLNWTTAQLVQSEKLSALGELAAGVAHELNQPLNAIKIICQSVIRDIERQRFDPAELKPGLGDIVGQVNKMADIIDHMRIFSRKTEGAPKDIVDINEIIHGAFKFMEQQLIDHNIAITKELASGLPRINGDAIRLEQVILNLLNNAKYAVDMNGRPEKNIKVSSFGTEDGKHIVIEVEDDGIGIPAEIQGKIFQPFFTTKEPGKGTGLGLSVTSQIIQSHKGRIEFENRNGNRTVFRIWLPAGR